MTLRLRWQLVLESFRVRLKIKCNSCAAVLGVQRLAGKVRCNRCSDSLALRAIWGSVPLADLDDAEPHELHLEAGAAATHTPEAWLHYECRAPRCDQCQDAPLDVDELASAVAAKRRPECPKCHAPVRLRIADGIAHDLHPRAQMIVAEGPDEPAGPPTGREDLYVVCEVDRRVKRRAIPRAEQQEQLDATERARRASRAAQDARRADRSEEDRASGALSVDEAMELAEHDDWEVRLALAHNPEAPPAVLERLARGDDATVRAAVAQHRALPASLFAMLARDPWPDVRRSIAKHPATPTELLQRLAGDSNEAVRAEVEKRGVKPGAPGSPPPAPPEPGEPTTVTLVGRVVEDDLEPRFIHARLQIDDERHQREHAPRFMLQLDDGAVVAVDPAGAVVGELDERTARWDEIATTPAGRLFADVAPGDHVKVRLTSFTIAPGARIAVRGRTLAKPVEAASAVRAQHLAIVERGDDAAAIASFDPPPPEPAAPAPAPAPVKPPAPPKPKAQPRPWRIVAPVMLGFGALALGYGFLKWRPLYEAVVVTEFPLGLALFEIAAAFALIALGLWASRVPFEMTESKAPTGKAPMQSSVKPWWERGKIVLGLGFVAMFTMLAIDGYGAADDSFTWVGAAPLVLAGVGALLVWLLRPGKHLRLARLVLDAPPATADATGTIEGTVQEIHTAVARTVEYTRHYRTRTEQVRNKDGSYSTREITTSWLVGNCSERSFQRFTVEGAQGRHEIVGGRATWGAPLEYVRPKKGEQAEIVTRAKIGNGDSIIALGRIAMENGTSVMNATGHESVLMFGAPADARATLARLAARWNLLAYGMLALVVAAIAASILIWTEDPPATTAPTTWPPVAPRVLPGERL